MVLLPGTNQFVAPARTLVDNLMKSKYIYEKFRILIVQADRLSLCQFNCGPWFLILNS
jgi:hypothetical protein